MNLAVFRLILQYASTPILTTLYGQRLSKKQVMSIKEEKKAIIELINNTDERWVLESVKRILTSEQTVSEYEKAVLSERTKMIKDGTAKYLKWDDVKDKL